MKTWHSNFSDARIWFDWKFSKCEYVQKQSIQYDGKAEAFKGSTIEERDIAIDRVKTLLKQVQGT